MNIKLAFATIAVAASATFASAQANHVIAGNTLIDGILSQASQGKFYDKNGVLTNRYGGSYGAYYITAPVESDPDSVFSSYGKCAPWVTMLLKESYGWVPNKAIGASPSAKLYYETIRDSAYGFTRRNDFTAWQEGDILASGYYDDSASSGHVMIMLNAQQFAYDATTNTREYWVTVMDCSANTHTNDTRLLYPTFNEGGVGRGVIRIKTINNEVKQWAWSNLGKYMSQTDRPIVLGYFNQ